MFPSEVGGKIKKKYALLSLCFLSFFLPFVLLSSCFPSFDYILQKTVSCVCDTEGAGVSGQQVFVPLHIPSIFALLETVSNAPA